ASELLGPNCDSACITHRCSIAVGVAGSDIAECCHVGFACGSGCNDGLPRTQDASSSFSCELSMLRCGTSRFNSRNFILCVPCADALKDHRNRPISEGEQLDQQRSSVDGSPARLTGACSLKNLVRTLLHTPLFMVC